MSAKLLILCAIVSFVYGQSTRFKVLYEWHYVNFTWPNEDALRTAMSTGKYIPENNLIAGLKYFDDWFYLTLPRMKQGVPATLTRIHALSYNHDTEPLLEPYPSWEMNTEGDCTALQNVQNVEIDTTGKIWILDGGRTGTMTKLPSLKCQPRLLIFDIKNNKTVTNYVFPEAIINNGSFLYDLVVDEVDGGYAYITDNSGADPGIVVYSVKQGRAWKIRDESSMRAAQDAIEFRVAGTALSAPINIAGIALGPRTSGDETELFVSQDRMVYYSPLSSFHMYSIRSSDLRNERTINIASKIKDLGKKSSQSDGMVADENGVLYYGLLSDNSIAKWDTKTLFTSGQKVIARDPTYIQWPDSLAFDMSGKLLVVTNRLQKFIYGQMNLSEPNYRILEAYLGVKSYLYGVPVELPQESNTTMSNSVTQPTMENNENTTYMNQNNSYYENHIAITDEQTIKSIEEHLTVTSSAIYLRESLLLIPVIFSVFLI